MRIAIPFLLQLFWLVFVFTVLEFGSGFWLGKYGNALDRTRRILVADERLGWRQRADLNTTFLQYPLRTNELGFRDRPLSELKAGGGVLLLGPSSTFGWGVDREDTYSAKLERKLAGIQVINGGEIGYSSYQGLRLLESPQVQSFQAKFVVFAYGVNDLDRNRFYFQSSRSDLEELTAAHSRSQFQLYAALSNSYLLDVLYKIANGLRALAAATPKDAGHVRVSKSEFALNVREFIHLSRRLNLRPLIAGTAVNLTETEHVRREVIAYNKEAREAAEAENAPYLDLESLFTGDREKFFVDPIHFSPAGNELVAEAIYSQLVKEKK